MKRNIQLLSLLLIAALTFSCGKSTFDKDILGTWESTDDDGTYHSLTFFDNGRFEQRIETSEQEMTFGIEVEAFMSAKMLGTWKVRGKSLVINYTGEGELLDYKINFLNLSAEEIAELDNEGTLTEEEKKELMDDMLASLPKGDQRYINLKIDETTLSYTALDGTESFTRKK